MHHQNIEPLFWLALHLLELDFLLLEGFVQSLISHVANSIQRNLNSSFDHQYRTNNYLLYVYNLAKVVDIMISAHLVQSAEHVEANRVVVVAVYREDGQSDP